ncbi:MAG: hypothetical protein WCV86_00425 [Patescibacteria group bacterium]|jgi:hypothetical protein
MPLSSSQFLRRFDAGIPAVAGMIARPVSEFLLGLLRGFAPGAYRTLAIRANQDRREFETEMLLGGVGLENILHFVLVKSSRFFSEGKTLELLLEQTIGRMPEKMAEILVREEIPEAELGRTISKEEMKAAREKFVLVAKEHGKNVPFSIKMKIIRSARSFFSAPPVRRERLVVFHERHTRGRETFHQRILAAKRRRAPVR